MPEYKGATVKTITELLPIEGADRIELARLGKYQSVVAKGTYTAGNRVIFIECDSVLPPDPWADEYRKYVGKRFKIVKLRGVFSEGIIAPLSTRISVKFGDPESATAFETEVEKLITMDGGRYVAMAPNADID